MDHHGLLTVLQRVGVASRQSQIRNTTITNDWKWDVTPVIYPESKCSFCLATIKSHGIWLLRGVQLQELVGAFFPVQGDKLKLVQPSFPHMLTSNMLCLGNHLDGVSLLAAPIYFGGMSIIKYQLPVWYKKYWSGHVCSKARDYLNGLDQEDCIIEQLQELDSL